MDYESCFGQFYSYWQAIKSDKIAANREAFDPCALSTLVSRVIVLERNEIDCVDMQYDQAFMGHHSIDQKPYRAHGNFNYGGDDSRYITTGYAEQIADRQYSEAGLLETVGSTNLAQAMAVNEDDRQVHHCPEDISTKYRIDYLVRLIGSEITDRLGQDITKQNFGQFMAQISEKHRQISSLHGRKIGSLLEAILRQPMGVVGTQLWYMSVLPIKCHFIFLPMLDSKGDLTQIIGMLDFEPRYHEVRMNKFISFGDLLNLMVIDTGNGIDRNLQSYSRVFR